MKSRIRLYKIELFGYHGVDPKEQKNGQNFAPKYEVDNFKIFWGKTKNI